MVMERKTFNGRPATVAYLDDHGQPVANRELATLVRVLYDDGEIITLVPDDEDGDEIERDLKDLDEIAGDDHPSKAQARRQAVVTAGGTDKREKVSKVSVNYRPGNLSGRHCGNCSMFHARARSCDMVKGTIYAADVCDEWVKRG